MHIQTSATLAKQPLTEKSSNQKDELSRANQHDFPYILAFVN